MDHERSGVVRWERSPLWLPIGDNEKLMAILWGVAQGIRHEKIAKNLKTSRDVVDLQLSRARKRTRVSTTVALMDYCFKIGVFDSFSVPEDMESLSEVEERTLLLRAEGYDILEAAEVWGVSFSTVKFHSRTILVKLGADTMAQAVVHYRLQQAGKEREEFFSCKRCGGMLDVSECVNDVAVARAVRSSGGMRVFEPGSGATYFCALCTPGVRKERGLGPRMPLPEELEDPRLIEKAVHLYYEKRLSVQQVAVRLSDLKALRISQYRVRKLLERARKAKSVEQPEIEHERSQEDSHLETYETERGEEQ